MAVAAVKTILVVDDEPVIRALAELSLRDERWRVRVASDAGSALAEIGRGRPDLIFLDIGLPGMSGRELARSLKTNGATARIPIVYLTGLQPPDCGDADAVLTKPFTPESLHALASNWL